MKLRLVSLKEVANKLKQNPVMADLQWDFIVTHAADLLALIGVEAVYVTKTTDIEVKDYRAMMPHDLMGIVGVSNVHKDKLYPMRTSEDTLAESYAGFKSLANENAGFTYTTSHSAIFTNFEKGTIVVTYRTLATDEDCFPLIPGNVEIVNAVEAYIRYKWYDVLNDLDQMSDRKLAKVESEYAWRVGQAQSAPLVPNPDEMETLVNSIVQMLPDMKAHKDRYQYLGAMEQFKIQQ